MLRFRGLLSARARELVILVVAASWESEFEWWAHVRIGKQIGLTDDEIDAVRTVGAARARRPGRAGRGRRRARDDDPRRSRRRRVRPRAGRPR